MLDPLLQRRLPLIADADSWDHAGAAAFSAPASEWRTPPVDAADDCAPGQPTVKVRVYRPAAAPHLRAGVLWLHGGGFTGGDLEMAESDYVARELAFHADSVVVTAQYRLVDDAVRYPLPLDDVITAWEWLTDRATVDAIHRLVIGGSSAGGALAAGAALRLRDSGARTPDGLMLAYPALHAELPEVPPDLAAKVDGLPRLLRLDADDVRLIFDRYVGAARARDPYAVPGTANLSGLPSTIIINSEYDALRVSGERFAADLAAAGVPVESLCEAGVLHGHLNTIGLAGAERTLARFATFVREIAAG